MWWVLPFKGCPRGLEGRRSSRIEALQCSDDLTVFSPYVTARLWPVRDVCDLEMLVRKAAIDSFYAAAFSM